MLNKLYNTIITGTGIALPDQVITNFDLEKLVDTNDEWIVTRTGIKERRKLQEGLGAADLAAEASTAALEAAGLKAEALDLIIVATVTPDHPTPSTACLLQAKLGADKCAAVDVAAGCTGFVYALTMGSQFISTGAYKNILVVGVEVLSRFTDWKDRSTCILFGDGAGAVVISGTDEDRGIIDFSLNADGRGAELLIVPAGGSVKPASFESVENRSHFITMNGNEIFKFAVRVVDETVNNLLNRAGYSPGDIDLLILHQANMRIIEHIRKKLKLPKEKVTANIDRYGNTSAASVPIALHEEIQKGMLRKGDLVALVAFGAGLTWGGMLIKW